MGQFGPGAALSSTPCNGSPSSSSTWATWCTYGSKYEQWPDHFGRFESILGEAHGCGTARGNHESGLVIRNGEGADWFFRGITTCPARAYRMPRSTWGNTIFAIHLVSAIPPDSGPWLDTHLATVDKDYVFVLQHYPIYCTGYY